MVQEYKGLSTTSSAQIRRHQALAGGTRRVGREACSPLLVATLSSVQCLRCKGILSVVSQGRALLRTLLCASASSLAAAGTQARKAVGETRRYSRAGERASVSRRQVARRTRKAPACCWGCRIPMGGRGEVAARGSPSVKSSHSPQHHSPPVLRCRPHTLS